MGQSRSMETLVYAAEAGSVRLLAVRESVPPVLPKPRLLDRVREALRARHYSRRTEEAYVAWIRRYIFFHGKRHPGELGGADVTRFLSALAVEGHVAASTQNQALRALLFLYRDVLDVELPWLDDIVRAKRPERLPVVLSRDEVRALIQRLDGAPRLMACLLYGAGLRVMECCRLRVQDVGFGSNQIVVRGGKGDKDRTPMLPTMAKADLAGHLAAVRAQHQRDLAAVSMDFGKRENLICLEDLAWDLPGVEPRATLERPSRHCQDCGPERLSGGPRPRAGRRRHGRALGHRPSSGSKFRARSCS